MSPSPEPVRRTVTFTDRMETHRRTPQSSASAEVDNVLNMESEERRKVAAMLASWPQPPIHRPKNIPLHNPHSPSAASTEGYSEGYITPEKLGRVSKWLKDASEALYDPVWRPQDSDNLPKCPTPNPTSCVALTAAPTYLNGNQGFAPPVDQGNLQTDMNFHQVPQSNLPMQHPTYQLPTYGYIAYNSGHTSHPYGIYQQSAPSTQVIESHFRPIATPVQTYSQLPPTYTETVSSDRFDERLTCPNCLHQYWIAGNNMIPVVPRVNRQATETCTGRNNLYTPQPIIPITDAVIPPPSAYHIVPRIQLPDMSRPPPGYPTVSPTQHNIAAVVPQQQQIPESANSSTRKRPWGVDDTQIRKLTFTPNRQ